VNATPRAAGRNTLVADALLVVIGQAVFPGTRGYVHFQFHDYAKLTVIGVIIACAAWAVVRGMSGQMRRGSPVRVSLEEEGS
jgi:H+/Cl- antiporter ClcA